MVLIPTDSLFLYCNIGTLVLRESVNSRLVSWYGVWYFLLMCTSLKSIYEPFLSQKKCGVKGIVLGRGFGGTSSGVRRGIESNRIPINDNIRGEVYVFWSDSINSFTGLVSNFLTVLVLSLVQTDDGLSRNSVVSSRIPHAFLRLKGVQWRVWGPLFSWSTPH